MVDCLAWIFENYILAKPINDLPVTSPKKNLIHIFNLLHAC